MVKIIFNPSGEVVEVDHVEQGIEVAIAYCLNAAVIRRDIVHV